MQRLCEVNRMIKSLWRARSLSSIPQMLILLFRRAPRPPHTVHPCPSFRRFFILGSPNSLEFLGDPREPEKFIGSLDFLGKLAHPPRKLLRAQEIPDNPADPHVIPTNAIPRSPRDPHEITTQFRDPSPCDPHEIPTRSPRNSEIPT